MKSKVLACLLLSTIFIVSSLAAESVFSNYDFTFYRTVSESLAISDSSTIGFDYTGFGFVGTRNTSGLFLRIGIQLPYTTLTNIVEGISGGGSTGIDEDEGEEPGEGLEISTGSSGDSSQMEYRLTFVLGPGIRYVFSPFFDFYAGIGPKLEEHIMSTSYSHSSRSESTYNTSLALDMDIGFKFNLEKNTSCRIGVYSTFEILSYTYSKPTPRLSMAPRRPSRPRTSTSTRSRPDRRAIPSRQWATSPWERPSTASSRATSTATRRRVQSWDRELPHRLPAPTSDASSPRVLFRLYWTLEKKHQEESSYGRTQDQRGGLRLHR